MFSFAVHPVCTAASGVCKPSLVSLAGGGQGAVGEDPEEGSEYGVRTEGWHLRGEVKGAEPDNPGGEAPPGGHDPGV